MPLPALQRDMGAASDLRGLMQTVRALRRHCSERPVIVHTHSSKAGVIGRVAAKLAGAFGRPHGARFRLPRRRVRRYPSCAASGRAGDALFLGLGADGRPS